MAKTGETLDPLSNHNDLTSRTDCDPKSTSDTDSMEDTAEFRLLMAYAKRRRPKRDVELPTQDSPVALNGGKEANGSSSPQTPAKTVKKKKKGWKKLLFRCIKPQTQDEEHQTQEEEHQTPNEKPDVDDRLGSIARGLSDEVEEEDKLEKVAATLTEIADEIPFTPPEVEADSPEDANVERVIGLLLRDAGDRLNEKELIDGVTAREIFWNYSFFDNLITTLLRRMGLMTDPDSPGPQASPKTHIAVTCEVASRLSAVDTLPMNRLLGYGARYLQDHYSSWAQQQGGYEQAFYSEDEED